MTINQFLTIICAHITILSFMLFPCICNLINQLAYFLEIKQLKLRTEYYEKYPKKPSIFSRIWSKINGK